MLPNCCAHTACVHVCGAINSIPVGNCLPSLSNYATWRKSLRLPARTVTATLKKKTFQDMKETRMRAIKTVGAGEKKRSEGTRLAVCQALVT